MPEIKIVDLGTKRNRVFEATLVAVLVALALKDLTVTAADYDLWGYLSFGRLFWDTGRFPYQDVFAFLPTLPRWIYHEWLTGVLFYPIYQSAGAAGLQLLKYGLALTTLALIYLTARARGADVLGTVVGLFAIQGFLTIGYSPVRAQVFTYAFFALTLYLLETARLTHRGRRLWLLAPLQVLWCNLHGGFLAGLGLTGLYFLGAALSRRSSWPYAGILILSGLATLINPYGWDYWQYLFSAISMPRPDISEWASVYATYVSGMNRVEIFYIAGLVLFFALLAWRARWRELTPILALSLTLYLGLKHSRHLVFFLLLAGAYLPLLLTAFFQKLTSDPQIMVLRRHLGWKIPALAALSLLVFSGIKIVSQAPLSLKTPLEPLQRGGAYYPVGALDYIKKHHLSGNLLTEFNWGEYLIWHLFPRCKVSLDGRYETVYPDEVAQEYFDFLHGRANWRRFLERYPPAMVLISSTSKIYALMGADPHWRQVYHDRSSALFVPGDNLAFSNLSSHAPMGPEAK